MRESRRNTAHVPVFILVHVLHPKCSRLHLRVGKLRGAEVTQWPLAEIHTFKHALIPENRFAPEDVLYPRSTCPCCRNVSIPETEMPLSKVSRRSSPAILSPHTYLRRVPSHRLMSENYKVPQSYLLTRYESDTWPVDRREAVCIVFNRSIRL